MLIQAATMDPGPVPAAPVPQVSDAIPDTTATSAPRHTPRPAEAFPATQARSFRSFARDTPARVRSFLNQRSVAAAGGTAGFSGVGLRTRNAIAGLLGYKRPDHT